MDTLEKELSIVGCCGRLVPQLSVPAPEPAAGLSQDHHVPEMHAAQWGGLQRQGETMHQTPVGNRKSVQNKVAASDWGLNTKGSE